MRSEDLEAGRIPAHRSESLAAAGPRTRSHLGGPWVATSNLSRGDRSGCVPDGPKDHPSLVSLTSHLRRSHPPLPHRSFPADGAGRNSTSRHSDRQHTPSQGPSATTRVQPRPTCRWLRACEWRTSVRIPACGGVIGGLGPQGLIGHVGGHIGQVAVQRRHSRMSDQGLWSGVAGAQTRDQWIMSPYLSRGRPG